MEIRRGIHRCQPAGGGRDAPVVLRLAGAHERLPLALRQFGVDPAHRGHQARPCPVPPCLLGADASDALAQVSVTKDRDELFGERGDVAGWEQQPGAAVVEDLGGASDVGGDDGQPMHHAFEDDHAERLIAAGNNQDVGRPVPTGELGGTEPAGEVDPVVMGCQLWWEPVGGEIGGGHVGWPSG